MLIGGELARPGRPAPAKARNSHWRGRGRCGTFHRCDSPVGDQDRPLRRYPDTARHPGANRRHRGIAVRYRRTPIACAGPTGVVGELYRSGIQLTGVCPPKYQAAPCNIASTFPTPRADLPGFGPRACTLVPWVARCGNVIRPPENPHPAPGTGEGTAPVRKTQRTPRDPQLSTSNDPRRDLPEYGFVIDPRIPNRVPGCDGRMTHPGPVFNCSKRTICRPVPR